MKMWEQYYPFEYVDSVFSIDFQKLYEKGYRGILLDIDNTLVHHGDDSNEQVDKLFRKIHRIGLKTLLISNNDEERIHRFTENIDTLFICDADKPDPKNYLKAIEMLGIKKEEAVMIGDQVFTDILGANRSQIASILVKFIRLDGEKKIGKRRYLEFMILKCWKYNKKYYGRIGGICKENTKETMQEKKAKKLFCEISPLTYAISQSKERGKRHIKNFMSKEKFCKTKKREKLPNLVFSYNCGLIKKGKGIDPVLQKNKAKNIELATAKINGTIVHPGETFSFWKTIGKTSKRKGYRDGRIIIGDKLMPGIGGGLCNLGNALHLLVLHSPLTVTELHCHSDALAPDHGKRIPFSSGTSVSYNYIDYRFRNDTDQDIQILTWCQDERLYAEMRSEKEFPYYYEIIEEDHHFHKERDKFFRISKIYRNVIDRKNEKVVEKQLVRDNHSEVMFDYDMIPEDLIW